MNFISRFFIRRKAVKLISQEIETATRSGENLPMNPLEQFAITIVLGVLQTVVKNPTSKAALQGQLLGVATDIAASYGYTLTPPATPAA